MGVAGFSAGIEQLLLSLEQLEQGQQLEGKEDDLAFLRGMLKTPEFKSLLKVRINNYRGARLYRDTLKRRAWSSHFRLKSGAPTIIPFHD